MEGMSSAGGYPDTINLEPRILPLFCDVSAIGQRIKPPDFSCASTSIEWFCFAIPYVFFENPASIFLYARKQLL